MTNTVFDPSALKDLVEWAKYEPKIIKKIFELIGDIHKHPFEGLGKPEGLKHQLKGCWTDEHRLIYKILSNDDLLILSVHGHYDQ
jgi:toxin YoeB